MPPRRVWSCEGVAHPRKQWGDPPSVGLPSFGLPAEEPGPPPAACPDCGGPTFEVPRAYVLSIESAALARALAHLKDADQTASTQPDRGPAPPGVR